MANVISNCCEAKVQLSMGLVQFVLPNKVIKSSVCPVMSISKNTLIMVILYFDLQIISASL